MNKLRERATRKRRLKSLYAVLERELMAMEKEKNSEINKFVKLSNDEPSLRKYQKDSGLTKDTCERILAEIKHDLESCKESRVLHPEQNALDGECDLRPLYNVESKVPIVWKAADGQKPVDLIVLGTQSEEILMGDCKFGLKSYDSRMIRNKEQFDKEFANKFLSVGDCILKNDGAKSRSEMLLIVTSALAPLLKNRIEDFKWDPKYKEIPYDKIKICSIDDIYAVCQQLLPGFNQ